MPSPPPRILVFIVAYNAERHIIPVLNRIPENLTDKDWQVDVLIIDDSSGDDTYRLIQDYKPKQQDYRFFIGRTHINQGYGGNQKIGCHYAIQNGYDYIVLLHGDGQYPPEMIPDIVTPLIEDEADAVLGSRMGIKKNALRGGMPLYKWLGNMTLSTFQNLMLGTHLSEFHTGFRAYRVSALATIPFLANSNEFVFDTEILIQLIVSGHSITEINIPTHYGDEICHVNSAKYAMQCIIATLRAKRYLKHHTTDHSYIEQLMQQANIKQIEKI